MINVRSKTHFFPSFFLLLFVFLEFLQPCRILQGSNHSLNLQVVVEAVDPLLPPDTAHLVPSERDPGVEHVEAVHPHCPSLQPPRHRLGSIDVRREDACCQPVPCLVRSFDHLVYVPATG